jgi:nicotinamidase-related amidase
VKVTYPIIPKKTAMLVVDMQNDFVQEGAPIEVPHARAMVPRLNRLLDVCRTHKIPVIYIHHVLRGETSMPVASPTTMPPSGTTKPSCRDPQCGDLRRAEAACRRLSAPFHK